MELRQLRYFVAVAEDLHFRRAAQRLHVAQSALSAQVRGLERAVGGPLLDRSTRNVRLTEAGEALASEAAVVLRAADRALAEARGIARRTAQTLALGCLGAPGDLLEQALDAMAREVPEATIDVQMFDFAQMWDSLIDGRVDVSFAYLPAGHAELDALETLPLVDEPRVVVVSASHELAERDELRPRDLAEQTFVTHSERVPEWWRSFWLCAEQLGRPPAVHDVRADSIEKWLYLIQQGQGIDTCPAYVARYYGWPKVRYVPLRDAPPATLALIRRRGSAVHPLAERFTEAVRAAARREERGPEPPPGPD